MQKKKVFAISGSTRNNSSNEAILDLISQRYGNAIELEIFTGITLLPYFNPDVDKDMPPASVLEFRQKIEEADGVLFCTPEYVFSLPGILKNAIEWTVSTIILLDKPVAFIVAAASGEKAFESLDLILRTVGAKMPRGSKQLIRGVKSKFDSNGRLKDEATLEQIEELMASFLENMAHK